MNSEDEEKASKIGKVILNYISYDSLLLNADYFKNNPLFALIIKSMFNASDLNKEANIIDLIRKYNEIKTALKDEDNLLLSELNKWELENDKLDLNKVDDELIEDCFSNSNLNISKVFIQDFNNQFKNLSEESYKTVFDL